MSELPKEVTNTIWLLRTIITAEATIIIMMITFFVTGYQTLVTHDELEKLPYPYLKHQAIVEKHMRDSEYTMKTISDSLQKLNERITKENHATTLRITLLEKKALRR